MGVVIPAVLTDSSETLKEQLQKVAGLTDRVQIDVVDGKFASPATWPYSESHSLTEDELLSYGSFQYEVDLMVQDPMSVAPLWVEAGANRLTIHTESIDDFALLNKTLREQLGYEKGFAPQLLSIGLALEMKTDLHVVEEHLATIDYVQFMGIEKVGVQGQPFDERVYERIEHFRKHYPHVPIQVDGGVSLENAPKLLSLGVSRLVIGSRLWNSENLRETFHAFDQLKEQYGTFNR